MDLCIETGELDGGEGPVDDCKDADHVDRDVTSCEEDDGWRKERMTKHKGNSPIPEVRLVE